MALWVQHTHFLIISLEASIELDISLEAMFMSAYAIYVSLYLCKGDILHNWKFLLNWILV